MGPGWGRGGCLFSGTCSPGLQVGLVGLHLNDTHVTLTVRGSKVVGLAGSVTSNHHHHQDAWPIFDSSLGKFLDNAAMPARRSNATCRYLDRSLSLP